MRWPRPSFAALLIAAAACSDMGPQTARILTLGAYRCPNDTLPCTMFGARITGLPPRGVGKYFGVRAYAPNALLIAEEYRWPVLDEPGTEAWVRYTYIADSVHNVVHIWQELPWVTWKITLPWQKEADGKERILDVDSLRWEW